MPRVPFEDGLRDTVEWYQKNEWWWRPVKEKDPAFKSYYEAQYGRTT
jgi:dTDP-glucose 4,6-dehydratase